MKQLDVIAFQGASNLPMWVAEERGFFARHGLAVTLAITPNSVELALDLHSGRRQVALTAFDNVVTYVEAQGEAGIEGRTDFFAFMGIDDAVLSLMAAPDVEGIAALRGRGPLAVDALTTGYAFVLREMLRLSGLKEAETPFFRVGGHGMRLDALLDGRTAATLLTTPPDLVAEARGFRRLARATEMLGAYAGVTGNACRTWAAANRETLVAFIRAWRDAVDWITAAENRDAVGALFRARIGGAVETADRACAVLIDPVRGLRRDLSIDPAGIDTVLRLRSAYARPERLLTDPDRYIDLSFLDEALRG